MNHAFDASFALVSSSAVADAALETARTNSGPTGLASVVTHPMPTGGSSALGGNATTDNGGATPLSTMGDLEAALPGPGSEPSVRRQNGQIDLRAPIEPGWGRLLAEELHHNSEVPGGVLSPQTIERQMAFARA